MNLVIRNTNSQPIVRMTAKEFMMGYESPLTTLGNTLLPHWIHFDKVGLIDRVRCENMFFLTSLNDMKLSRRCMTSPATLRHFTPAKRTVACLACTIHSGDHLIFHTGTENTAATFKPHQMEQNSRVSSRKMRRFCSSGKACVGLKDWWVTIMWRDCKECHKKCVESLKICYITEQKRYKFWPVFTETWWDSFLFSGFLRFISRRRGRQTCLSQLFI